LLLSSVHLDSVKQQEPLQQKVRYIQQLESVLVKQVFTDQTHFTYVEQYVRIHC